MRRSAFYLAGWLGTSFSSCEPKICRSVSGSIPGFLGEPKMVCVFPEPVGPIATRRPLFPPKKSSTSGFITCAKTSSCGERREGVNGADCRGARRTGMRPCITNADMQCGDCWQLMGYENASSGGECRWGGNADWKKKRNRGVALHCTAPGWSRAGKQRRSRRTPRCGLAWGRPAWPAGR